MSDGAPAVLVFSGAAPELVAMIAAKHRVLGPYPAPLLAAMSEADRQAVQVFVTPGSVPNATLDGLPNLRLIACLGVGYDGIDLAYAKSRGVRVTNNPGANAPAVAEMAVALFLAVNRDLLIGDRFVRAGQWPVKHPARRGRLPQGVMGRKVGILGLGAIGRAVAQRLAGFDAEIGYHNRRQTDAPYRYFDSVQALAAWADDLILALRADASNNRLVDRAVLEALGPAGTVVNVARGSVIDEPVMIEMLRDGRLAGAGLDVFDNEPNIDPAFLDLPNVVLMPHEGGGSLAGVLMGRRMLMANIDAFFANEPLPTPVL